MRSIDLESQDISDHFGTKFATFCPLIATNHTGSLDWGSIKSRYITDQLLSIITHGYQLSVTGQMALNKSVGELSQSVSELSQNLSVNCLKICVAEWSALQNILGYLELVLLVGLMPCILSVFHLTY